MILLMACALPGWSQLPLGLMHQRSTDAVTAGQTLLQQRESHARQLQTRLMGQGIQSPISRLSARPKHIAGASTGATLRGSILSNTSWAAGSPQYGLYTIQTTSPELTKVYSDSEGIMYAQYGGAVIDHLYYLVIGYDFGGFGTIFIKYVFNLETMSWEAGLSEIVPNQSVTYLAWTNSPYDKETQLSYGCFFDSKAEKTEFCSMDYKTFQRKKISNPSALFMVMAIDESDGQLYAINQDGLLYKIDKTDGTETYVGDTGLPVSINHQAAAIDSKNKKLYWNFIEEDQTAGFAEVDLQTAETRRCFEFDGVVQFGDLHLLSSGVTSGAPGEVADIVWHPSASNNDDIDITFTMPSATDDGETTLSGQLRYVITLDDSDISTGEAMPGERVTVTLSGLSTGKYLHIGVCAENETGRGNVTFIEAWAGQDTPAAPENVGLNVDGNGQVTLAWDACRGGTHGGYVDLNDIEYRVYLEPEKTLVATVDGTTCTTQLDPARLRYALYAVTAYEKTTGLESEKSYSNTVKVGEYLVPKYEVVFDDINKFNNYWTVINANHDQDTWTYNDIYHLLRLPINPDNGSNDWLVSSPVYLEKGKLYTLQFDAYTAMGGKLELAYAPAAVDDVSSFTTLLQESQLHQDIPMTYETTLTVEETGTYHFGLHEYATGGIYTNLTRFCIQEGVDLSAPVAPTNLRVTPAEQGALKATITCKLPTVTVDDHPISTLNAVNFYRDDLLIGTLTSGLTPCGMVTYNDDQVPADGSHTYSVRVSNESGLGMPATKAAYIGIDDPDAPYYAVMTDNGDGTVTVNWENSLTGQHGGYVDLSRVGNALYEVRDNSLGAEIARVSGATTHTSSADLSGNPGWYYRAVTAYDDDSESEAVTAHLIKGTPVALPLTESFANRMIHESRFWWATPAVGNTNWGFSSKSADGDNGCVTFTSQRSTDEGYFGSRKLTLAGSPHPYLSFQYSSNAGSKARLKVQVDRGQRGQVDTVADYDMASATSDGDWKRVSIDLSAYLDEPYIIVRFLASNGMANTSISIDNIKIQNMEANDLAVSISAPSNLQTCQQGEIVLTVVNQSNEVSGAYKVKLDAIVDGQSLLSHEVEDEALAADGGQRSYPFTFDATPFFSGDITLKAEVLNDDDHDTSNNTAQTTLSVYGNLVPAITDLTANTESGPFVKLQWSQPEGDAMRLEHVTDDFERYTPWSVDFGEWETYDGDMGETGGIFDGINYPNQGLPFAYIIFNPNNIVSNATQQVPTLKPRSGNQYAATLYSINDTQTDALDQDNWLISPELPGLPQTVTFYIKTMSEGYPHAAVEVLYSTTDSSTDSFTRLGDIHHIYDYTNWTPITVNLPAGTTHFAIRDITPKDDTFMMMIDDVSYTAVTEIGLAVTGYNIYVDGQLYQTVEDDLRQCEIGPLSDGAHTIYVTALYSTDQIESALSNPASVTTGIQTITAQELDGMSVTVYSPRGAVISEGAHAIGQLQKGVYLVKVKETGQVRSVIIK